jgi:hypothetical protein
VALIHSMRLSLMKGAHADLSSTAWQEIGVKPGFGLSGIPQHSTSLFCSNPSATLFAFSKNRGLKPLAQPGGQFIDFVIAVNLDGLLRGTQGDHAVLASLEVDLQIGDQASRHLVIEKIAELRQKL